MAQLATAITEMLELESQSHPDWRAIEKIADEALAYINGHGLASLTPNRIYQFLDDVDIRRNDARYGLSQRNLVLEELKKSPLKV